MNEIYNVYYYLNMAILLILVCGIFDSISTKDICFPFHIGCIRSPEIYKVVEEFDYRFFFFFLRESGLKFQHKNLLELKKVGLASTVLKLLIALKGEMLRSLGIKECADASEYQICEFLSKKKKTSC